jgi:hypothetical protein
MTVARLLPIRNIEEEKIRGERWSWCHDKNASFCLRTVGVYSFCDSARGWGFQVTEGLLLSMSPWYLSVTCVSVQTFTSTTTRRTVAFCHWNLSSWWPNPLSHLISVKWVSAVVLCCGLVSGGFIFSSTRQKEIPLFYPELLFHPFVPFQINLRSRLTNCQIELIFSSYSRLFNTAISRSAFGRARAWNKSVSH